MAYKKAELEATALDAIKKHNLVFIEDVCSFLPCDKKTFYAHKLHECNPIKEALDFNKIRLKVNMRKKWYESEQPTLQVALYKLIGSDEETDRLSGTRQKVEMTGKNGDPVQVEQTVRVILPTPTDESDSTGTGV